MSKSFQRSLPPLPMRPLPLHKCGRESAYVDQMDINKELRAISARVLAPNYTLPHRQSLTSRPRTEQAVSADEKLDDHSSSESDDSNSSCAGEPQAQSANLMMLRCSSPCTPRRSSIRLCANRRDSSPPFAASSSIGIKSLPPIESRTTEQQGPGYVDDFTKKSAYVDEILDEKTLRTSIGVWRHFRIERIKQKQPILDQYLSCCSNLQRSPFLQVHVRRFLIRPSACMLDLSHSGIAALDLTALICALAGRGCDLRSEKTDSIQLLRLRLGDQHLSALDLSSNGLASEGAVAILQGLAVADFFRVDPLPSVSGSIDPASLSELDLSRNALGPAGAVAIGSLLASPRCSIRRLALASNLLSDSGCAAILRSLLVNKSLLALDVSDNGAADAAGQALGLALEENRTLSELVLAYNHLRGQGARFVAVGLGRNRGLFRLDLQWNGFGDEETLAELARAFGSFDLEELNLAHNRVRLRGASILASALEVGCTLRELILDGNLLGQIGARVLYRAAEEATRRGQEFMTSLRTTNCGVHMVDHAAFDPCEAAGDYDMDLRDAYHRSVLSNLVRARLRGEGSFVPLRSANASLGSSAGGGKASAYHATVERMGAKICDNGSIDAADWTIVTVTGVKLPITEENGSDGQSVPLAKTWSKLLGRVDDSLTKCSVRLTFKSSRRRANPGDRLSEERMGMLRKVFSNRSATSDTCGEILDVVLASDTFIAMDQVQELFGLLRNHSDSLRRAQLGVARITFLSRCFHKLVESERSVELVERLASAEERISLEKALGMVSLDFTPNNPTGYYKLDLCEPAQREMCMRLLEIKNGMQDREAQFHEFYSSSHRAGGRREGPEDSPDLERVWRNSRLNGEEMPYRDGWKVPRVGILELDFVEITKPQAVWSVDGARIDDQAIQALFMLLDSSDIGEKKKVAHLRKVSNTHCFTCQQLAYILDRLQEPELRVEACVIGFARTIDWYGYRNVIFRLSLREHKMLQNRIGYINLFNDVMAVDYYELDLSHCGDRFLLQELLHLAAVEPGDNMLACTFQGIDFKVPAGWLKNVPRAGLICFCYCREQRVIEKVFHTGSWDNSGSPFHTREDGSDFGPAAWSNFTPQWIRQFCEKNPENGPSPCPQPHDGDWVRPHRIRYIKMKMMEKFSDPKKMFGAMDRDGGGSLDRKELAVGLFALGVWLCPSELQILLDTLDKDGGGDVDFSEFRAFWNKYSFD